MKPANTDTLQLNPVAKAAFGLASVTFEVRAHYWRITSGGNLGCLAREGTKPVRPDAGGPFQSVGAHFNVCKQSRR